MHACRDLDVAYRLREPVRARLSVESSFLGQIADRLLDEERVSAGSLDEEFPQRGYGGVRPEQACEQVPDRLGSERDEGDLAVVRVPHPPSGKFRAEVGDDQRAGPWV